MGISPDTGPGYTPLKTSGKRAQEMLYNPDSLNALFIMGEDPVITFPDSSKIVNSLKALDFLIVQDIALTDTAKLAHVVLPASSWAEKDGTFINTGGTTQKTNKVVDSKGHSLPDWQILRNLVLTMGHDLKIRNLASLSEEMKNIPREQSAGEKAFNPVEYKLWEEADVEYPFKLIIRDILHHSGSMSSRSESLALVVSEALLEINEEDANKFGILDNSHVKLTSRQGSVFLKASVSEEVPEGTVYVPPHFPHAKINTLTQISLNGESPIIAVNVERA
jgi:predicted molibdopterin-dependent oxidoreductase YjgC